MGKQRLLSLALVPEKIMGWVILETISGHMKKVMGNNQRGFTEGKLCLIASYDRITGFKDAERARAICFDLEKLLIASFTALLYWN